MTSYVGKSIRIISPMFLLLCLSVASYGQQDAGSKRFAIEGTAGWAGFPDENMLHHGIVGGSFRVFLIRGLNVAPEVLYMVGPGDDRDVVITPTVGYQFRRTARVQPYVIGGVGWLIHRELFLTGPYWSTGASFGGGGGFKVKISDRLYVAPEVRLGWEPALRTTVTIGYTF